MLQASEGGSFSVGERKFKIKESVTPRPVRKPPSSASPEGVPVAMPTNLRTDRISRISPLRLSMLSPATDKMVVSKSALVGFCLTSFAGGIVMTLAVDRVHARAAESPREPDPVVLKTTPIETAPAPSGPAAPVPQAAPVARPLPAPVATSPAAAEAVVVQLPPPPGERQANELKKASAPLPAPALHNARKVAVATPVPASPPPAVRRVAVATPVPAPPAARKVAAATPARAVAPRKQPRPDESSPTEAAPEEDPVLPTATKKKWTDPFDP